MQRDLRPDWPPPLAASVEVDYTPNYPVTVNHAGRDGLRRRRRRRASPANAQVERAMPPVMGGEDFSYMLEARPGAFIFIGNGDTAGLHHPDYDFNDEAIPHGMSYWVRLAETALGRLRAHRRAKAVGGRCRTGYVSGRVVP